MKIYTKHQRLILTTLAFLAFLILTNFLLGPCYEALRRGDFHKHYQQWLNKELAVRNFCFTLLIAFLLSKLMLKTEDKHLSKKTK